MARRKTVSARYVVVPADTYAMLRAPRPPAEPPKTPLEVLRAVVCWCRHDVTAHLRGGCIRSDCLCLDTPELVRWAAEHPRAG